MDSVLYSVATVNIAPLDTAIVVIYLLGIMAIGLFASRGKSSGSNEYFLAGRSLRWPVIGMALFATNISTVHLVGLAADGYRVGFVVGNFEWMAVFFLVLLGVVFAPFYFRNKIATLPEYLERRFSGGSRMILAVMGVVGALFIHIGLSLYAGSTILNEMFGIHPWTSIVIISIATAIYTVTGGLKAVVLTEAVQTVLLLVGALCITVLGIAALREAGIDTYAKFSEAVEPQRLSMIQTEGDYTWYSMALGYPVLAIWYWCADQTIVQRVLGAETERDAQFGPIFAGLIKILPLFLMVLPGVIAYALFRDEIGVDYNKTLPTLLDNLVPTGLKGLIAAGLLAALMSTIAGALNSSATLVSIDILQKLKPGIQDKTLVLSGRITACVVMCLAMAWSTQGGNFKSIFEGGNAMIACLAPPISVVFIWGVLWKRGTSQASLVTLTIGFILGITTFTLDFPVFGETKYVTEVWHIPFMMQAFWLFAICSVLFVLVSFLTPCPAEEQVEGLCWKNPLSLLDPRTIEGVTDPRVLSLCLIGMMVALYVLFA